MMIVHIPYVSKYLSLLTFGHEFDRSSYLNFFLSFKYLMYGLLHHLRCFKYDLCFLYLYKFLSKMSGQTRDHKSTDTEGVLNNGE